MSDTNPTGFVQAAHRSHSRDIVDAVIGIIVGNLMRWVRHEPVNLTDVHFQAVEAVDDLLDEFEQQIRGDRILAD